MTQAATQQKKTREEIKVLAINTLYECAAKFYQYEKEHFNKFIGQAIFKVDGSVKAKFEHDKMTFKGQLPDGTFVNAHYWFTSRYSFDMTVKICINGGSYDVKPNTAFCQYEETTIELFKIDKDGKIQEASNNPDYLNTRYHLSDLKKISEEIKEAAKVYELTENKMPYIFRETFYIQRLTN
jgi:hypothetical protein